MSDTTENKIDRKAQYMKGKNLIVESKKFAVENPGKSWYLLISTMFVLAITLFGSYYDIHWSTRVVCSIIYALTLVRMFIIYHDYLHGALLKNSWVADVIMKVFGVFTLAPTTIWKRSHDYHHHNNSKLVAKGVGAYPLVSKKEFSELNDADKKFYLFVRSPLAIFGGYLTMFFINLNIVPVLRNVKAHYDSLIAIIVHLALGTAVFYFGGWDVFLLSFFLPFCLMLGLGSYLFYVQHNFESALFEEGDDWNYTFAALNSTSHLVMSPIMNWFTGNIGYHHVHHLNHKIPFYRLKETMDAMPDLQHPKTTTLMPGAIIRCLRLKVWDPELRKMTPLD